MRSSLVLCFLLGVVISVKAASVPPSEEPFTVMSPDSTYTVTEVYTDVVSTTNILYSMPIIPFTTPPCCVTSPSPTSPSPTPQYPTPQYRTPQYPNPQTSPSPSQMTCPDGWEVFQGRCYYFVNGDMTWPQALSNCALLDSVLVSVHSAQEYGFLQQLTSSNGNQNAWLGGFYLQGQWLWIDGSWFYNNSWINEAPDSSNPCLLLSSYEAWSNSPCDAGGFASICAKNIPQALVCLDGWMGFQGRCYYHNYEFLTWSEADTNCASLGASLVSVHSPQEYYFLYHQTAINGFSPTWLGGFYLEDQWMWLDGSWFYQGFFTQMSLDSTNPCLSTESSEGWSNYNCDRNFPSFCVKDAL